MIANTDCIQQSTFLKAKDSKLDKQETDLSQNLPIIGDIQEANEDGVESYEEENKTFSEDSNQEDYSSSNKNSKSINKREKRLMQNRQSASRLRIKKKENFKNLGEETEYLQSVNLELRQEMENAQEELFQSMNESIQLRKKIDELQKKQNNLLIEALKLNEKDGEPAISSRRTSESFSANSPPLANDFNSYQQPFSQNQFVLGSQSFDLQAAVNLLLSSQQKTAPIFPLLNKGFSLQNSGLLFGNLSEFRDNALKMTTSLPKQNLNQIGMLLNAYTNDTMSFNQCLASTRVQN